MKLKLFVSIGCALTIGLVCFACYSGASKRKPPAKIKPIQINGIEYRIPNKVDSEGILEAWKGGSLLWKKKMYHSLRMPLAEDQGNFVRLMTNGPSAVEITIVNERGAEYILDTATGKLKRVKSALSRGSW